MNNTMKRKTEIEKRRELISCLEYRFHSPVIPTHFEIESAKHGFAPLFVWHSGCVYTKGNDAPLTGSIVSEMKRIAECAPGADFIAYANGNKSASVAFAALPASIQVELLQLAENKP